MRSPTRLDAASSAVTMARVPLPDFDELSRVTCPAVLSTEAVKEQHCWTSRQWHTGASSRSTILLIMPSRTIAIGDIHGCTKALATVLAAIDPQADDTLVLLGDYIDRGPDSRGTIVMLLALARRCQLVPLLGNHDELLLALVDGQTELMQGWLQFGGTATLKSYQCERPEEIPSRHIEFLRDCRLLHETDRHFFVHGSYVAEIPLAEQPRDVLLWESLRNSQPGPHCSGRIAIVGHTSQRDGEIFDLGYLTCIDTCCYGAGWLTAMDVGTRQLWQADKSGHLRTR